MPTYRGLGGLYNDKQTKEGITIEGALSAEAIVSRPDITWRYIAEIEKRCRGAKFNRAHQVIAELERSGKKVCVFTQNIDALHQQAGSSDVIDIHGDFHKLRCVDCSWQAQVEDYQNINSFPPPCPNCDSYLRPDVVFFGESLPLDKLARLEKELTRGFDLYVAIGTKATFAYIYQPLSLAKNLCRPLIEINPDQTLLSDLVDIKINERAALALDLIWSAGK